MSEPNEAELKTKVREFFELLFERHEPRSRAFAIAHFAKEGRSRIEKQMSDFYAEYGRLPVIQRDPNGGAAIVMETKKDVDPLPVENPPRPAPSISEEARRIGREDKELRAALRDAFGQMDPARQEESAKRHGVTAEELTEKMVDGCVERGWGEGFRLYHAKHGRYPTNDTELTDVAWMIAEENENWKANES